MHTIHRRAVFPELVARRMHTLLSAGGESTTSLLGNAARILAEDPALQQRLREKPEDVDYV